MRNFEPISWQIAETASGRIDAFYEYGSDLGNLISGALIADEAGLHVTDVDGNPWESGSDSFLTALPAWHRQLVGILGNSELAGQPP